MFSFSCSLYEFVKLELFCPYLTKFVGESIFSSFSSSPVFISEEMTIPFY